VAAVDACRWSTLSIPHAPYVTSIPWINHYGCLYVAHGDDITSDSNGEDCYRYVKAAGRFAVFKRTPSISTTDLVGRMLLCTKTHFIKSFCEDLARTTGPVDQPSTVPGAALANSSANSSSKDMLQAIKEYASDPTGFGPGAEVFVWRASESAKTEEHTEQAGTFIKLVTGLGPKPGQRIVYVDGGFDLFQIGHIEFLKQVYEAEKGGAYVVAGVHEDDVINHWKGLNYPIMNIFERGLCVLQCRYINAVIFGAPFSPSTPYLEAIPIGKTPSDPDKSSPSRLCSIDAVYHGPTTFMPLTYDPYTAAKDMGIYCQIGDHPFSHVNAGEIVTRILKGREAFEERQRKKGEKSVGEEAVRRREQMEREATEVARMRAENQQS
jgi:ethanolamine-phosphate cytidylyltransferase